VKKTGKLISIIACQENDQPINYNFFGLLSSSQFDRCSSCQAKASSYRVLTEETKELVSKGFSSSSKNALILFTMALNSFLDSIFLKFFIFSLMSLLILSCTLSSMVNSLSSRMERDFFCLGSDKNSYLSKKSSS
ncbi:hypothetical protein BpHYR1_011935, partial [Brachionus plicatilis]